MFKKLHLQMMLFCSFITGIIMISMSIISTISSEEALKASTYLSFQDDATSMVASLENQTVISYEWIARMEKDGQYMISISNNGLPLFYDTLNTSVKRTGDIKKATDLALSEYDFTVSSLDTKNLTNQVHYVLHEKGKEQFYISAAKIPNGDQYLAIVIVQSLENLQQQIDTQRLKLLALNLGGLCLLGIFSYFFTRWAIQPLKKSREQQAQFIAAASHELRTPLTVMLSSLSAMEMAEDEKRKRFSDMIHSEGNRMSRLIDDLLTLARMDSAELSIKPKLIELDTLLLDTAEKFDSLATQKKIQLSVSLPDETMPRCLGDRERLIQVFTILLDNAISYTPAGGRIELSLKQHHGKLYTRIADSGPGIPDDAKELIWNRFYRVDSSHNDRKHFGLGLSIAQEIVLKHKGRIRVEDAADLGGAAFLVILPVSADLSAPSGHSVH